MSRPLVRIAWFLLLLVVESTSIQLRVKWFCFDSANISWETEINQERQMWNYEVQCFSSGSEIITWRNRKNSFLFDGIEPATRYNCTLQAIISGIKVSPPSLATFISGGGLVEGMELVQASPGYIMVTFTESEFLDDLVYTIDCLLLNESAKYIFYTSKGRRSPVIMGKFPEGTSYSCRLYSVDSCRMQSAAVEFNFTMPVVYDIPDNQTVVGSTIKRLMKTIGIATFLPLTALSAIAAVLFRIMRARRERALEEGELSGGSKTILPAAQRQDQSQLSQGIEYQTVSKDVNPHNSATIRVTDRGLPSSEEFHAADDQYEEATSWEGEINIMGREHTESREMPSDDLENHQGSHQNTEILGSVGDISTNKLKVKRRIKMRIKVASKSQLNEKKASLSQDRKSDNRFTNQNNH